MNKSKIYWAILRILLGAFFFWGFLDKLFGLGFATQPDKSWLSGGSPTAGFLKFGVKGPLAGFYHALSGHMLVDWIFMIGLFCIGLALIVGMGVKMAGGAGILLTFILWTSLLPPQNNPIIDEHLFEMMAFFGVAFIAEDSGSTLGIGKWWKNRPIVQKFRWLE
jgi:thiosulfate dehydrogenase [quinone] large subunit